MSQSFMFCMLYQMLRKDPGNTLQGKQLLEVCKAQKRSYFSNSVLYLDTQLDSMQIFHCYKFIKNKLYEHTGL
jgi:hypothetical protein